MVFLGRALPCQDVEQVLCPSHTSRPLTLPPTPTPPELHQHPDSGVGPGPGVLGPGGLGPVGPGLEALPDPPELSNLESVARALSEVSLFQRDRMAAQLARPGYLRKLLEIFRVRGGHIQGGG